MLILYSYTILPGRKSWALNDTQQCHVCHWIEKNHTELRKWRMQNDRFRGNDKGTKNKDD